MLKCVKYYLKIKNSYLKTQTKHPLTLSKRKEKKRKETSLFWCSPREIIMSLGVPSKFPPYTVYFSLKKIKINKRHRQSISKLINSDCIERERERERGETESRTSRERYTVPLDILVACKFPWRLVAGMFRFWFFDFDFDFHIYFFRVVRCDCIYVYIFFFFSYLLLVSIRVFLFWI